jgi:hypothetical protein
MNRRFIPSIVLTTLLLSTVAFGQQTGTAGPVPAAIVSAHTIFISNGGSDAGLFPSPFSGDQNRPYAEFYKAMQADSRYQIVADPVQADLVLELRLLAPPGPKDPNKSQGSVDSRPQFRLSVYDRKTHYVLWTLTEAIKGANLKKTHNQNFENALAQLVKDFESLAA